LYLSTGDFRSALEALLGEDAASMSPTTIARLTVGWEKEYGDFRRRDLSGCDYVYVWVDGIWLIPSTCVIRLSRTEGL
jgi:hypothetical protein